MDGVVQPVVWSIGWANRWDLPHTKKKEKKAQQKKKRAN